MAIAAEQIELVVQQLQITVSQIQATNIAQIGRLENSVRSLYLIDKPSLTAATGGPGLAVTSPREARKSLAPKSSVGVRGRP